jgi:hypothetical protein
LDGKAPDLEDIKAHEKNLKAKNESNSSQDDSQTTEKTKPIANQDSIWVVYMPYLTIGLFIISGVVLVFVGMRT